ncbi:uncharacterized protein MELLADRAFT_94382 [Melampsora larici-populina 98AG31]|uniref:Uncharacterized protein n=1 Tax=Melampsora larici-populina (strain 98AG31 / pathotype 3-4-7) TaxID=747676 RepID=F4RBB1_MELLP|nr:uncharacterized protein MELLADRAFT_94382 [Melampsora larici-populina 98AG31]EGG10053.1 hypothetical protein MELLADRAFT_94382 [Melampsora larici-populina 98AG31]
MNNKEFNRLTSESNLGPKVPAPTKDKQPKGKQMKTRSSKNEDLGGGNEKDEEVDKEGNGGEITNKSNEQSKSSANHADATHATPANNPPGNSNNDPVNPTATTATVSTNASNVNNVRALLSAGEGYNPQSGNGPILGIRYIKDSSG